MFKRSLFFLIYLQFLVLDCLYTKEMDKNLGHKERFNSDLCLVCFLASPFLSSSVVYHHLPGKYCNNLFSISTKFVL